MLTDRKVYQRLGAVLCASWGLLSAFATHAQSPAEYFSYDTYWSWDNVKDEWCETVIITGCQDVEDLTIPDTINGFPVTRIGRFAFANKFLLRSVTVPASVTTVDERAFGLSFQLGGVRFLGDAPSAVGPDVFERDQRLVVFFSPGTSGWESGRLGGRLALPLSFSYTLEGDSVTLTGYAGSDRAVVIPQYVMGRRVTRISEELFAGCNKLTAVSIPATVTEVGNNAFSQCSNLVSVCFLGDAPANLGTNIFADAADVTVYCQPQKKGWGAAFVGRPVIRLPVTCLMNERGVTFTGFTSACTGSVTVASQICGFPVTRIGYYAFANNAQLIDITLPESVTDIGPGAFLGCTGLRRIKMPDRLTKLGAYAFAGCNNLLQIEISERITELATGLFADCGELVSIAVPNNVTRIGDNAFDSCRWLSAVSLGTNVVQIGASAFSDCCALSRIVLPPGMTNIGQRAFSECVSLKDLAIPAAVTQMGDFALAGCVSLTNISVAEENACFSSIDGVLFNRSQTLLIRCPAGKAGSYSVPSGVVRIQEEAFSSCFALNRIVLPAGLSAIGESAFNDCVSLTEIAIPASVESMGVSVFDGCLGITNFFVDADSKNFSSCEGVLFNGEQTQLVRYPPGRAQNEYAVPTSVVSLADGAFKGSQFLTEISIPASLSYIGPDVLVGTDAFGDCARLQAINVDPSNPSFYSIDGVLYYHCTYPWYSFRLLVRYPCAKAGPFSVPSDIAYIDECAFKGCSELTEVAIPASVGGEIWPSTFSDCTSLEAINVDPANGTFTSFDGILCRRSWPQSGQLSIILCPREKPGEVTLPENAMDIMGGAFLGCDHLTAINVAPSNTCFGSEGGVLYEKARGTVLQCPGGKSGEIALPALSRAVEIGAFAKCAGVSRIVIPDTVTQIGSYAFFGCDNLSEFDVAAGNLHFSSPDGVLYNKGGDRLIHYPAARLDTSYSVPSSVKMLDELAFAGSKNLTAVYFKGDKPVACGTSVFLGADPVTAYYLPWAAGWDDFGWSSARSGLSLVAWDPQVLGGVSCSVGSRGRCFRFSVAGAEKMSVVVEACTNLTQQIWQPHSTLVLSGGSADFADEDAHLCPQRYYRFRMP